MEYNNSTSTSEKDYSFYLNPDTPTKDAEKNIMHPFVLSIVSVFNEVLTSNQLENINYYATLIWDNYYDSEEDRAIMNEIPGGEQLLHVMMNMKYFVETLKTKISVIEQETEVEVETSPTVEQHVSKRIRN
jgi:hypothetical protein